MEFRSTEEIQSRVLREQAKLAIQHAVGKYAELILRKKFEEAARFQRWLLEVSETAIDSLKDFDFDEIIKKTDGLYKSLLEG